MINSLQRHPQERPCAFFKCRPKGWTLERRTRQAELSWQLGRLTSPRFEAGRATASWPPVFCLLSDCISPVVFESAWLVRRPIEGVQKNSENRTNKLLKPRFVLHCQSLVERQTRRAASTDRFFAAEKVNWDIAALGETWRDS